MLQTNAVTETDLQIPATHPRIDEIRNPNTNTYFFCSSGFGGGGKGLNSAGLFAGVPLPTISHGEDASKLLHRRHYYGLCLHDESRLTGTPELAGEVHRQHVYALRHSELRYTPTQGVRVQLSDSLMYLNLRSMGNPFVRDVRRIL